MENELIANGRIVGRPLFESKRRKLYFRYDNRDVGFVFLIFHANFSHWIWDLYSLWIYLFFRNIGGGAVVMERHLEATRPQMKEACGSNMEWFSGSDWNKPSIDFIYLWSRATEEGRFTVCR